MIILVKIIVYMLCTFNEWFFHFKISNLEKAKVSVECEEGEYKMKPERRYTASDRET